MKNKRIAKENIKRIDADFLKGLSEEEVLYMKQNGMVNKTKSPTNKSYTQIILGNLFTFFNILMFSIAGVLLLVVGPKVITNLMFLGIILVNILIGTIQECKSKKTIEKLKLLADSKNIVRRDGKDIEVFPNEIVLDDVVILSPGDQIPVDCVILEERVIEVNESLLTGESVPVKKSKGEMLYAGSFIVSGVSAVRAEKIGNDTYIQSIENKAKLAKQPKSMLMISINKIIKVMSFIAIPLAIIVFINEFIQSINANAGNLPIFPHKWGENSLMSNAVFYGGTTITYMIPAGMALLASISMATGVVKLAQSDTLAQDLYSVESLSRVNTLCLDKTGTLTDGTMMVESLENLSNKYSDDEIEKIISSYQSAFRSLNQTGTALVNKYSQQKYIKVKKAIEFSSARKFSAVLFNDNRWFILGAPEYLSKDKELLKKVEDYASKGLRVILLDEIKGDFVDEEKIPENKESVAMFIIRDNIRPEVKATMEWFRENDVDIKVISGDNIGTVSYIAKQSGIDHWDKVVDMSLVSEEDDLEQIVMNNWIFGRVTPDQKAEIISILKKNGRVTGVTGDGLNDLLAFKNADCSIALANGAAATKNVANLILLDSNFANMKEAVFQGRRVVNNIQRSASLFVMKDFLWMFVVIMPLLFGLPHMIQPTVMTIVNIFITGIASLFISLEPDKTRVTGNFYKNVVKRALVSGFYLFIPVLMVTMYVVISQLARTGSIDPSEMMTKFSDGEIVSFGWIPIMALCITISGFIVFFQNCKPFTKFRKILFIATTAFVVLVLYLIPEYFIISGTDMLANTGGVLKIFSYCIKHLGTNAKLGLYLTMNLEQLLFLIAYSIIAFPIYLINNNYFAKIIDRLVFAPREFKDE